MDRVVQRTSRRAVEHNRLRSLPEAHVVIEDWRDEYSTWRPHSSLEGFTPSEYAAQQTRINQPQLSWRLDQLPGPCQMIPVRSQSFLAHSGDPGAY